jgi:hypothetical protein
MSSLARDLDLHAVDTWYLLQESDRLGIRYREDTFTETLLFDLAVKHPGLEVERYDQSREAATGADWEWWIGRPGGWLGLRIQAKRADGGYYRQLGYGGTRRSQLQRLMEKTAKDAADPSGRSRALYPVVVFYNGWSSGTWAGSDWPSGKTFLPCVGSCATFPCGCERLENFGCAFAMASSVLRRRSTVPVRLRNYVPEYLGISLPWSYLMRPMAPLKLWKTGGALALRTLSALQGGEAVVQQLNRNFFFNQLTTSGGVGWDGSEELVQQLLDDTPPLLDQLPGYAQRLLDAEPPSRAQAVRGFGHRDALGPDNMSPASSRVVVSVVEEMNFFTS